MTARQTILFNLIGFWEFYCKIDDEKEKLTAASQLITFQTSLTNVSLSPSVRRIINEAKMYLHMYSNRVD